MINVTAHQKDMLRDHINIHKPELADRYFSLPEDYQDPDEPRIPHRLLLVSFYSRLSKKDSWFETELLDLLDECKKRSEPIPNELKHWALEFAQDSRLPPKRGRKPDLYRDLKMLAFSNSIRRDGHKQKDVVALLADVQSTGPEAISQALQRARDVRKEAEFRIWYLSE